MLKDGRNKNYDATAGAVDPWHWPSPGCDDHGGRRFSWDILTVQAEFFNRDTFVAGVGVV